VSGRHVKRRPRARLPNPASGSTPVGGAGICPERLVTVSGGVSGMPVSVSGSGSVRASEALAPTSLSSSHLAFATAFASISRSMLARSESSRARSSTIGRSAAVRFGHVPSLAVTAAATSAAIRSASSAFTA